MHIGVRGCDRHTINGKISAALMWPLSSCTHVTSPGSDDGGPVPLGRGRAPASTSVPGRRGRPVRRPAARASGSRPRAGRPRTDRATDAARLDRGAILTESELSDTIRTEAAGSAEPRLDRRVQRANAGNAKNPASARRLDEGWARPSGTPPRTRCGTSTGLSLLSSRHRNRLKPRGRQGV